MIVTKSEREEECNEVCEIKPNLDSSTYGNDMCIPNFLSDSIHNICDSSNIENNNVNNKESADTKVLKKVDVIDASNQQTSASHDMLNNEAMLYNNSCIITSISVQKLFPAVEEYNVVVKPKGGIGVIERKFNHKARLPFCSNRRKSATRESRNVPKKFRSKNKAVNSDGNHNEIPVSNIDTKNSVLSRYEIVKEENKEAIACDTLCCSSLLNIPETETEEIDQFTQQPVTTNFKQEPLEDVSVNASTTNVSWSFVDFEHDYVKPFKFPNKLPDIVGLCYSLSDSPHHNDSGNECIEINNELPTGKVSVKSSNKRRRRKNNISTSNKTEDLNAETIYDCLHCGKKYTKKFYYNHHIVLCASGQYQFRCSFCKKAYSCNAALKIHTRLHTGEKPFSCHLCEKTFSDRSTYSVHLKVHLNIKPFNCNWCSKAFIFKRQLVRHEQRHTNEGSQRPYSCIHCEKSFTEKSSLTYHIQLIHDKIPLDKSVSFNCDICARQFLTRYQLALHYRRKHTNERPFACPTCGKKFICNGDLKKHLPHHTGIKPFVCETCGKGFALNVHLKRHVQRHSGDKQYQCEECGKCYSDFSYMYAHKKTHAGIVSEYECFECGKVFISSFRLADHIRIHMGEKPYECFLCNKIFERKNYLSRHVRKVHNKSPTRPCGRPRGSRNKSKRTSEINTTARPRGRPKGYRKKVVVNSDLNQESQLTSSVTTSNSDNNLNDDSLAIKSVNREFEQSLKQSSGRRLRSDTCLNRKMLSLNYDNLSNSVNYLNEKPPVRTESSGNSLVDDCDLIFKIPNSHSESYRNSFNIESDLNEEFRVRNSECSLSKEDCCEKSKINMDLLETCSVRVRGSKKTTNMDLPTPPPDSCENPYPTDINDNTPESYRNTFPNTGLNDECAASKHVTAFDTLHNNMNTRIADPLLDNSVQRASDVHINYIQCSENTLHCNNDSNNVLSRDMPTEKPRRSVIIAGSKINEKDFHSHDKSPSNSTLQSCLARPRGRPVGSGRKFPVFNDLNTEIIVSLPSRRGRPVGSGIKSQNNRHFK